MSLSNPAVITRTLLMRYVGAKRSCLFVNHLGQNLHLRLLVHSDDLPYLAITSATGISRRFAKIADLRNYLEHPS